MSIRFYRDEMKAMLGGKQKLQATAFALAIVSGNVYSPPAAESVPVSVTVAEAITPAPIKASDSLPTSLALTTTTEIIPVSTTTTSLPKNEIVLPPTTTTNVSQESIDLQQTIDRHIAPKLGDVGLRDVDIRPDDERTGAVDIIVTAGDDPESCASGFVATSNPANTTELNLDINYYGPQSILRSAQAVNEKMYGSDAIGHADNRSTSGTLETVTFNVDDQNSVIKAMTFIKQQHTVVCAQESELGQP